MREGGKEGGETEGGEWEARGLGKVVDWLIEKKKREGGKKRTRLQKRNQSVVRSERLIDSWIKVNHQTNQSEWGEESGSMLPSV